jgi:small subunit ribosomal protein S9
MRPGTGQIIINRREVSEYFGRPTSVMVLKQPLEATDTLGQFDIFVNVAGGGLSGQAGAVRHGISRALLAYDPSLRPTLKVAGFLTRDPRAKERKKYGQKAARARFQFSKR